MPLDLHIERLIVDGVAMTTAERGLFAASLASELTRLLRDAMTAGRLPGAGAIPATPVAAADLGTPFDAGYAGTAVANAVYASLASADGDSGGSHGR